MTVTAEQVQKFADLFQGRDDVFGVLLKDGSTKSVRMPLTLARYTRHLTEPDSSLGVYPLRDDGTCSFVVADIDKDDYALALCVAAELNVPAWIERSKSKGHHVWVFFATPTPAIAARRFMQGALDRAGTGKSEIFPKQDKLDVGAIGNFIHLPYAASAPTGRRVVLGSGNTPYSLAEFLWAVSGNLVTLPDDAPLVAPKPKDKKRLPVVEQQPRPACMQAIVDAPNDVGQGYRNEALMRLAAYEITTAQSPDAYELVKQVGDDMGLPLGEINHVLKMNEKGGYEYGCNRKREIPLCEAACNHEACRFDPGYVWPSSASPLPMDAAQDDAEEEAEPEEDVAAPSASLYDEDTAYYRTATPFLREFIEYVVATHGVPRIAAYADAIAFIAGTLGNHVYTYDMGNQAIFPHLWLLVLGPSGSGKTSAIKAVQRYANDVLEPARFLSTTGSTESWIQQLSVEPSRIMVQDEIVTWLQQLRRKGMETGKGVFTDLYSRGNGRPYVHDTRAGGKLEIHSPAITLVAASTVDYFQQSITTDDFRSGFLGRLLILPSDGGLTDPTEIRDKTIEDQFHERFLWIRQCSGEMHFADESREALRLWQKERKEGAYRNAPGEVEGVRNRLAEFALKIAICLHLTEVGEDDPTWYIVRPEQVERAMTFLDWLVPKQIHFIEFGIARSDHERKCQLMRDRLTRAAGKRMARSALRRSFGWESRVFNDVLDTLVQQRYIRTAPSTSGGPGRPAEMITLVRKRA